MGSENFIQIKQMTKEDRLSEDEYHQAITEKAVSP